MPPKAIEESVMNVRNNRQTQRPIFSQSKLILIATDVQSLWETVLKLVLWFWPKNPFLF